MSTANPTKAEILQYSFIALPLAFASLPLYIHAPDFYTREFGLGIGLIGVVLLVIRLFDAFQDPVIGYISDKYPNKRLGIITFGATILALGMAAVFYGPQLSFPVLLWFAIAMIFATTGFSIIAINLNMIGGLWKDDKDQRTRISGWREAFALCGLLIASIVPAALENSMPASQAYQVLFWAFAVIMAFAFLFFFRFMTKIIQNHDIGKEKSSKGFSLLPILKGPEKHFYGVCFLTHLAAAIPAVMVLFFIRSYLGAEEYAGLFLFLYFIAGAILIMAWVKLAEKIGKEKAWFYSMVLAVATFIWAFFLEPGDIVAYAIICVLSGMALGADLALPPSILADRVTERQSKAEATQYYALLALVPKFAIALASGIAFISLDILGFDANQDNSEDVLSGLITLYALVPCLIKLCAAFYLWRVFKLEGEIYGQKERMDTHGGSHVS